MSRPLVLIIGHFDNSLLLQLKSHPQIDFRQFERWEPGLEENHVASGLIIRSKTKVDSRLLQAMPQLKVVVTATSGFDHIDLELANEVNVVVGHAPEAAVESVGELFLLLALSACRKQNIVQKRMSEGNWDRGPLRGQLMTGKTLGIVGCGRIGSRVAEIGNSLGLRVLGYDPFIEEIPPNVEMVGYDELLRMSDIISFHVPGTDRTKNMLNESTLEAVHSEAIIINTSRGGVVNESQLAHFLRDNPKAYAALDVFANEPLAVDSALYQLNNIILSPHLGAATDECLSQSSFQAIKSVESFFSTGSLPFQLPPPARWWVETGP